MFVLLKKLKIITKNPLFCRNSSNFVLHTVITFFVVSCNYRDGNANVRFHQQDTLERIFSNGVSTLHFCTFLNHFHQFMHFYTLSIKRIH